MGDQRNAAAESAPTHDRAKVDGTPAEVDLAAAERLRGCGVQFGQAARGIKRQLGQAPSSSREFLG